MKKIEAYQAMLTLSTERIKTAGEWLETLIQQDILMGTPKEAEPFYKPIFMDAYATEIGLQSGRKGRIYLILHISVPHFFVWIPFQDEIPCLLMRAIGR